MRNRKIERLLDCPQGGDLECGIRFADYIGQRSTIELRVDVRDVVIDGQRNNYPFDAIACAYALTVLAARFVESHGLTGDDLAVGVTVYTLNGTPLHLRNSSLEERATWSATVLRSDRGTHLRRGEADLIAATIDALAQRAAQPLRRAAA